MFFDMFFDGVSYVGTLWSYEDNWYETAIYHPRYNNGERITVEVYGTKEDARNGQLRWIEVVNGNLPDFIYDVYDMRTFRLEVEDVSRA